MHHSAPCHAISAHNEHTPGHKTSAECTNSVHQLTVHHFAHQWFLPVVTPVSPITRHQHHQFNNTCIQSPYPNLHRFKSLFNERHYPHTFFVVITPLVAEDWFQPSDFIGLILNVIQSSQHCLTRGVVKH